MVDWAAEEKKEDSQHAWLRPLVDEEGNGAGGGSEGLLPGCGCLIMQ